MTDYYLPRLRRELAEQAQAYLGVENVAVENANDKFDADLTIPVFAFAFQRQTAPNDLATELAKSLNHEDIAKVEPSGGFVNIWLESSRLAAGVIEPGNKESYGRHDFLSGQEVVIEHTDANPFKELHIGHIYSNTIGECLSRLHEAAGAKVHRVSYHGDVGLHIAKSVWAIGNETDWQVDKLTDELGDIGTFYAIGSKAYEEDEQVATDINELNKKIYDRTDETVNAIYDWGRKKSFAYFEEVYKQYDTPSPEEKFLESQSGPVGLKMVQENIGRVFEESDGAVVFRDEEEHTRVFINSQGLPTYEAKDLGLAKLKKDKYPEASTYLIITANEVNAYFNVVLKALGQIDAELADKTKHLSHGLVKLPGGKMSSRTGDVVLAGELLENTLKLVSERSPEAASANDNALAAIKYAFLKQNIGGDVVYSAKESVNLEGQTGPYVQYAGVRINSILAKIQSGGTSQDYDWQAEQPLLWLVAQYPEVTKIAAEELAPHGVSQYLYELAREFNRYYESTPVKDAPADAQAARVQMLSAVLNVLELGLSLLNISMPSRM